MTFGKFGSRIFGTQGCDSGPGDPIWDLKWVLMGPDGSQWVPMGPDGFQWVLMGPDGFRWVPMGPDGSRNQMLLK